MRITALVLGIVIAAGACASSGTAAGDQTVTSTSTRPRTNVISTQEIRESTAPSVADLIRQVRPTWPTNVTLFVNNDAIADPTQTPNQLRNLSKNAAMEIRFYTKSEAQMKWSSRYQEVIQVITR